MKRPGIAIFLSISLISCSGINEKNKPPESKDNRSELSIVNQDSVLKANSSVSTQFIFTLKEPDIPAIQVKALASGTSLLYTYLIENYDTITTKNLTVKAKNLGYSCEYLQLFDHSIQYFQDECHNGTSVYSLTIPMMDESDVKRILALLFASAGQLNWSHDSLSHKTSGNGLDGAGGEFQYIKMGDKLRVNIVYTD